MGILGTGEHIIMQMNTLQYTVVSVQYGAQFIIRPRDKELHPEDLLVTNFTSGWSNGQRICRQNPSRSQHIATWSPAGSI